MAAVAPTSDQAADLLQKMTLDSQSKTLEVSDPTKKYGAVDSSDLPNGAAKPFERSTTPLHLDPNAYYFPNGYPSTPYFYGYDGQGNEWSDYSKYVNPDGVELSNGVYSDGLYHQGYGYTPYGAYPHPPSSPVPTMGHDGQLYGPQHYQYPNTYYQSATPTSGNYTPNQNGTLQGDISNSAAADQIPLSVESGKGNGNTISNGGNLNGNNGAKGVRQSYQNSSLNTNSPYGRGGLPTGIPLSSYQDPRLSPYPWLDGSIFSDGQSKHASNGTHNNNLSSGRNQNLRPLPNLMNMPHGRPTSGLGQASGFIDGMYPNKMYGQYGNAYKGGSGFGSFGYESRLNGRGWLAVDNKYKPRGRGAFGYGNENMDGLNELNRGPRAKGFKNQKGFGPITLAVKGRNLPLGENNKDDSLPLIPDKDLYNKEEFPENYSEAKFFVIKSYSEDDVHKSIKYGVWASTPNGNKKLDAAYQETKEKPSDCPIFLLFSVNTSGQFVGLAEMVGPVDFDKTVEYWQQDKWNGCFPVKWHIVKDVPNSLLKHITLENNDNKPVTNSRDTQEVKFEQGMQVLKIFKEHTSRTCILDDFVFYEARQRTMQEKKTKQQQFQKQALDVKPSVELQSADTTTIKDASVPTVVAALSNGEMKQLEENGSSATGVEDAKQTVASEKKVFQNGVASAC